MPARSSTPTARARSPRPRPWSCRSAPSRARRSTRAAMSMPTRRARPRSGADVTLPFGGVPVGIKELESVEGWPLTEASLVYADRVATYTSTQVHRLRDAGAVLAAQTTASEFGGINVTSHAAARRDPQPLEPRAHPGRVVGGNRRRGGGRPPPHRLGWRRRRVHSDPGLVHGHVRAEVELRPDPQGAVRPPDPPHRHRRVHQQVGP